MPKTVDISSPAELTNLLKPNKTVVVFFWSEQNEQSKSIAPYYDQLSEQLSGKGRLTFAKVNKEKQEQIAGGFKVNSTPAFIIFKSGKQVQRIDGADTAKLDAAVKSLAAEAEAAESSSSTDASAPWLGASLPRGYTDVTSNVKTPGLDLMNYDRAFGAPSVLFSASKPKGKDKGKGASTGGEEKPDWVESDTDEQLMLYIPFNETMKVHTLQITSLPARPDDEDYDEDETPKRPRTLRIYNKKREHNLGWEEADDLTPEYSVELKPEDWAAVDTPGFSKEEGTANVELKFVKFQSVTSLIVYVVDGEEEGESEKVRIDRIRVIGEAGEKRDPGKLQKIDHDD